MSDVFERVAALVGEGGATVGRRAIDNLGHPSTWGVGTREDGSVEMFFEEGTDGKAFTVVMPTEGLALLVQTMLVYAYYALHAEERVIPPSELN